MSDRSQQVRGARFSVFLSIWLFAVWLFLFHQITWLTVLSGIVVSVAVQAVFPLPRSGFFKRVRPWPTIVLIARFLWDMMLSAIMVATVVLTGRAYRCSIVKVDLRSGRDIVLAIVAAMTNLVPGTVVVSLDQENSNLYLHVFDIDAQGGPEGINEMTRGQEERVIRALGTRQEIEQVMGS